MKTFIFILCLIILSRMSSGSMLICDVPPKPTDDTYFDEVSKLELPCGKICPSNLAACEEYCAPFKERYCRAATLTPAGESSAGAAVADVREQARDDPRYWGFAVPIPLTIISLVCCIPSCCGKENRCHWKTLRKSMGKRSDGRNKTIGRSVQEDGAIGMLETEPPEDATPSTVIVQAE